MSKETTERKRIGEHCGQGQSFVELGEKIGRVDGKLDSLKENFSELKEVVKTGLSDIKSILQEKISKKDLKFGFFSSTKGKIIGVAGGTGLLTGMIACVIEVVKQLTKG